METFNVFLTTDEGESAPARLVIELDTLTVIVRDDPVAGWNLREVVATRTGPETLHFVAEGDRFTVATTKADALERLLPREDLAPPSPPRRTWRSGRHRAPGPLQQVISELGREIRRPPPTPAAWALAAAMVVLIVLTVWSIVAI